MPETLKVIKTARVVYSQAERPAPEPTSRRVVYSEAEQPDRDAEKYRLWQAKRLIEEAGLA